MGAAKKQVSEMWRRRLFIPCYKVGEAARYAGTTPQTVARWHRMNDILSHKEPRAELSYKQLIEMAVVAKMRAAGLKMPAIRDARAYMAQTMKSEFPFAEYKFKTNGVDLYVDYAQVDPKRGDGKLLVANKKGQLGWTDILGRRLEEFEYEDHGSVIRWHVGGKNSKVTIDPRIAFGAPAVLGVPTWAIKGRWEAGEDVEEIADDFDIGSDLVMDALMFEGIKNDHLRQKQWAS